MTPLVTAILPVYNRARWIARAVRSVLAQTYPSVELIVVDDGSDDGTTEVLADFEGCLTLLHQPRAGAYAARNLAIARARGDFVAFIDSDDVWLPQRLSLQVPLMERPGVGLVFGDAIHVSGTADVTTRTGDTSFATTPPRRGKIAAHFAWGNFVPTSAVLLRKRCFEETGPFSTLDSVSADYLKWFQVALRYELEYVSGPVVEYTVHEGGISYDLERSLRARIRLFSDELARTTDAGTRDLLRHLLFNLAMHLAWATARGRSSEPRAAWRVVRETAAHAAGSDAAAWTAAFALHHLGARGRRLIPVRRAV